MLNILNNIHIFFTGKGEEQGAAALLSVLVYIQLGASVDTEEVFNSMKPILLTTLQDSSASSKARRSVSYLHQNCHFVIREHYPVI